MSKITKEMEDMADKMEKASTDPKDRLFSIIKSLGPEGLKAKMAELSDEEKVVLKATLEEMTLTKAISFDKEIESAKVIQGKVTDTIIQEEIASDDADEKLVKLAAAKMDHQGTPTDGWQGQVIKANEEENTMEKAQLEMIEANLDMFIEKAMDKYSDDKMVMKKLKEKGMGEEKVQGALDKYKAKKDIEKAFPPKVKEEGSEEDKEKDPKKKPVVEAEKKENPFKKSVAWEDENRLLKANTQGRNFNFNIEQFIEETIKNENNESPIAKSENKKDDLNDLIEKSMDQNWTQVNTERLNNAHTTNGTLVKSFADKELAEILGLTEAEAKAILG